MKLLLLTDIPPNRYLTAGIVLDAIVRRLPEGSVACFAVVNPELDVERSWDLGSVAIQYVDKPKEAGPTTPTNEAFRRLKGSLIGRWQEAVDHPRILRQAEAFAREQGCDAVWAVLQGQTMAHLAAPLAKRLGAPLYTHVWDPLSWWIKAHKIDPTTGRRAHAAFEQAMRGSAGCATASWAMARVYNQDFGVHAVPVINSHARETAHAPPPIFTEEGRLTIGMAGQFYAMTEWEQLIVALQSCGWRIGSRDVHIKVLGHWMPPTDAPAGQIEHLGWKTQAEAVEILSSCDVCYCGYPFGDDLDEVSRLSFPSKLVTYLAAGRPVLFHGPKDSSPAVYLREVDAAVYAYGRHASAAFNALAEIERSPELFKRLAINAQAAFLRDFTYERMRDSLYEVLGVDEQALVQQNPVANASISDLRKRKTTPAPVRPPRAPLALPGWGAGRFERKPEVISLRAELAGAHAETGRLAQELTAVYAFAETLKQSAADAEVRFVESEQAALANTSRLRSELDTAVEAGQQQAISYAARNAHLSQANGHLSDQLRTARLERRALDQALAGVRALAEQLQTNIEAAIASRDAAHVEKYELGVVLGENISNLEAVVGEKSAQLDAAETARLDLYAQLVASQQRAAGLEDAVGRALTERDAALTAKYQETVELTQRNSDLSAKAESLSAVFSQEKAEMQRQLGALTAKLEALPAAITARDEALTARYELGVDLDRLKVELQANGRELGELHARLEVIPSLIAARDEALAARDAALTARYELGVELGRRNADLEVRAGLAAQEKDQTLYRVLGKLSRVEYALSDGRQAASAGSGQGRGRGDSRYLDLLEQSLTGVLDEDPGLNTGGVYVEGRREIGWDWPTTAKTMIGLSRMSNLRHLVTRVLEDGIEGDLIETGVWRGGACIYMRGILAAYGDQHRRVWVADSFDGLPPPDELQFPQDADDQHYTHRALAITLDQVKENFRAYGLLDDRVKFLKGWFKDTLPTAPIEKLSLLRLDGDMYESTIQGLDALYNKVSPGGFVIVDDYVLPPCRKAVDDFRAAHGVGESMEEVDGAAVYWRRAL